MPFEFSEIDINEPSEIIFQCRDVIFEDIDSKFTIKFTLDNPPSEHIKDFGKIKRMIWKINNIEYTFSQVRVEDKS